MTVDLTSVAVSVVGGIFSVLMIVVPAWLASKFNDKTAGATVAKAVSNSLGVLQQAAVSEIQATQPHVSIPGVPASLVPGVQYVLDHAGTEANRLGIDPVAIAQKIDAQIGLVKIQALQVPNAPVLSTTPVAPPVPPPPPPPPPPVLPVAPVLQPAVQVPPEKPEVNSSNER